MIFLINHSKKLIENLGYQYKDLVFRNWRLSKIYLE
jgi:hypothetical protein